MEDQGPRYPVLDPEYIRARSRLGLDAEEGGVTPSSSRDPYTSSVGGGAV